MVRKNTCLDQGRREGEADGYTYTNEFHSDGVKPVGHAVANQILTKAFKACGIVDVKVKELTGSE